MDQYKTIEYDDQLDWPLKPKNNPDIYQHSMYSNRGGVGLYTKIEATLCKVRSPILDDTYVNPLYFDPQVPFVMHS